MLHWPETNKLLMYFKTGSDLNFLNSYFFYFSVEKSKDNGTWYTVKAQLCRQDESQQNDRWSHTVKGGCWFIPIE